MLTEKQREILETLRLMHEESSLPLAWCTPLDIGGHNGSQHSGVLAALARKGLVQFKQRHDSADPPWGENGENRYKTRGAKLYRITPAGRAALEERE